METRGKRGRRVPLLLRECHIRYIDKCLLHRADAGVFDSNKHLFALQKGTVQITNIIRRESLNCEDLTHPQLLRATFLRKQVASTPKLLDLNDNDMQKLSDFMGHSIHAHKSHYRTPGLTLHIAKLSKLLIAMDEGQISNLKDKNLQGIDVEQFLNAEVNEDTDIPNFPQDIDTFDDELQTNEQQAVVSEGKPYHE